MVVNQMKKSDKQIVELDSVGPSMPRQKKYGLMHLIECTCILPQYIKRSIPVFHKFTVFSIVNEDDTFEKKVVQCNNCGIIHRILDVCKSEIVYGFEDGRSAITINDIKCLLDPRLSELLSANECELPVWEYALFIVTEQLWGTHITISSDIVDGRRVGKFVIIAGPDKFGISQYSEVLDISTK